MDLNDLNDLNDLPTDDLKVIFVHVQGILGRRSIIEGAPMEADRLAREVLGAEGLSCGDPWRPVTGAHDAYPLGWTVSHDGRVWESLRAGNPDEPGVEPLSSWRELVPEGEPPAEWQRPQAHNPYMTGDRVTWEGGVWESLIDHNSWTPTEAPTAWQQIDTEGA